VKLTLENLAKVGAFTGAPAERDITWKQGSKELTCTVFVRPMSYKTAVADIAAINGSGEPAAARIASCICDEDGVAIFTTEDVTGEADPDRGPLDRNLTMALLQAIGEVSGLGKSES